MKILQCLSKCIKGEKRKKELCIVHIGMPKTGTSALQISLFRNIDDPAVSYANLPVASHSAVIYSMFSECPENHYSNKSRKLSVEDVERANTKNKALLIEGFVRKGTKTEIISGEDIFHLNESELIRLKKFLEAYFSRIIIAGYVRPPRSFMESAFQQLVKFHDLKKFDFNIIYPHYREKLEKFDTVFGRENVRLWKYDPKEFPNNDIVSDFCFRLDIKSKSRRVVRANETLSLEAISLVFLYNKYGKRIESDNKLKLSYDFIEALRHIGKKRFRFSPVLIRPVLEKKHEDILWIENRIGKDLNEKETDDVIYIKSEDDLCDVSLGVFEHLVRLLKENNIETEIFQQTKTDILEMLFLLRKSLA